MQGRPKKRKDAPKSQPLSKRRSCPESESQVPRNVGYDDDADLGEEESGSDLEDDKPVSGKSRLKDVTMSRILLTGIEEKNTLKEKLEFVENLLEDQVMQPRIDIVNQSSETQATQRTTSLKDEEIIRQVVLKKGLREIGSWKKITEGMLKLFR